MEVLLKLKLRLKIFYHMYKLGITGGIASGKTTATNYLQSKYGAYIFNADKESKKHLKSSIAIQKKIISIFGNDIVQDKKINFELLANKVFSNPMNHKIINGILWPEVYVLIDKSYDEIKRKRKHSFFIVDAALIFEAHYTHFFDSTLLITTNKAERINRAVKRKNISLENIQNRIALQMKDSEKKKIADTIINNNSSIKTFENRLDKFYESLDLLK